MSAIPDSPGAALAWAYEVNGRRVPREAFYAVACDPRRSVAVEACAGAGKTWMLVSRILRALLEGAQPHEVLAITFTKKAAGEMRERLQHWLAEFAQADDATLRSELQARGVAAADAPRLVEPLRGLYRRLLECGRPVQIRTFHSWFASLLRTAPLGALEQLGLPAVHDLLEDDSEAVAKVWRRFHDAVAEDPEARADFEASVAAHGRGQTQRALHAALDKRIEFDLADARGVVDASVQPWDQVFPDLASCETPRGLLSRDGPVRDRLAEAARLLGRATQKTFCASGSQLERALSEGDWDSALNALLTATGSPRKFGDKLEGIAIIREAQDLALRLAQADGQHQAWLHHGRMARLARRLVTEYAALKRDEGWVDMNDVERAALVLLADPVLSGWVQERLDARVRHLLVDEFQDTNPLQWQALHGWLSGYAGSGGGGAPGVFIVGDPKQSIYRFRRAEPQVFRAAQRFVVDGLGGDLLGCDHTRRNAPAVLAAMNAAMAAAQDAGEYEGFRTHTTESEAPGFVRSLPAIPRPGKADAGEADDAPQGWRDSLQVPRELPEERLVTLECRQAARWLAQRLAAGLAPQDVMVLARKRDRLVAMQDELRLLGIPSQQPEKADLCQAPEVQDLVALVDVLVSPGHDLSLARALRSPLFAAPDEALVALATRARERAAEQGFATPWLELLRDDAWTLPAALSGAGAVLARWKRWVERLPPHDALDAIFHDGDVLARYAQAAPPALREATLANLRALLGAALQVAGGRFATPYALVRALRAGGIRAPSVARAAAVRLLTVHGAKGLEAPLVLLLDTDAPPARAETMGVLVDWPGEAQAPVRFAFIASETSPPACCRDALDAEHQARRREELNALYVAATRARAELALSCVAPRNAAPGTWWRRLQALCEPVEGVADLAPAAAAPGAPADCWLPMVPLGRAPTPVDDPHAGSPSTLADPLSRFGQALHRLLECWPAAGGDCPPALRQRVAREFGLTAAALAEAADMAARILGGEGAWCWDPAVVDWAGNEVELHHRGELLRVDRLVRRRQGGEWWVFDYKSAARPERSEALLAQLRRYRDAVSAVHPGEPVRAAFLTGQGRLVPLA